MTVNFKFGEEMKNDVIMRTGQFLFTKLSKLLISVKES